MAFVIITNNTPINPGMASLPSFPHGQQYRKGLSLKGSQVSFSDAFWDSHIFA